ncbi:MAG: OmpA family protein [Mariprofundaceae bacterium]|nr:OmpA family protein [Mariprofundaceae bacterium]
MKRSLIFFTLCLMMGVAFTSCKTMSPAEYEAMHRKAEQKEALERQLAELQTAYDSMKQNLKSEIDAQRIQIEQLSEREVKVTMPQDVLFPSASIVIDEPGRDVLGKVAASLRQAPDTSIRIVGHTDLLPITRPELKQRFTDNWELSAARAAAVARVFIWGESISEERVQVVGRSHAEPVDDNRTVEGRAKNRRIEIFLEQSAR